MPLDPKDPKNFDVFASIASGESSDHAAAASSSERAPTARPGTDLRGCGKRFGAGCQTIALSGYGDAHECCGHRGHAGNCRCWCAALASSPVVPEPHVEPCDYAREVQRVSELLTDFDPTDRYTTVSDHLEALLARFAARSSSPVTPEATTFGLPRGESAARNEICDALTEAIVWIGELADAADESTTLDLRHERHIGADDGSLTVRALMRILTQNERDEAWRTDMDKLMERTWERVARALTSGRAARSTPTGASNG